jgi:hypothetical protein
LTAAIGEKDDTYSADQHNIGAFKPRPRHGGLRLFVC